MSTPHLQGKYRDKSRKLADLVLRLQKIADDITAEEGRRSA